MASLLPSSIHKFLNISHRGARRRRGRVEERITPWAGLKVVSVRPKAPQRVTALVHRVTTLFKKRDKGLNIRNQTDANVLNNQNVVINVTQTDAGVSTATTSLLSQAPLNAQTTGGYDIENPRILSSAEQDMVITDNGAVGDQTDVGGSHTLPISAQATTSFNIESSRSLLPFEVVSNGNAHEVRDQLTGVDMSDTAPLLPQILIAAQGTSSSQIQKSRNLPREEVGFNVNGAVRDQTDVRVHHTSPVGSDRAIVAFNTESSRNLSENPIRLLDTASLLPQRAQTLMVAQAATTNSHRQNPRSLPHEGGQSSPGVANTGSGMPSQHSRQPPSPIEGQNKDSIEAVITDAKEVVNRLTIGSVGFLLTSVAAVNGKVTADHFKDNPFFTALVSLSFASLSLATGLYRFINIKHPESIPGFVRIVKFTNNLSQLILVYTGCCGFCLLFSSVIVQVVIMIVPLIPIGFVAILGYARRGVSQT